MTDPTTETTETIEKPARIIRLTNDLTAMDVVLDFNTNVMTVRRDVWDSLHPWAARRLVFVETTQDMIVWHKKYRYMEQTTTPAA